jgi:F0F1-type ATP synthase membrane subunit b/b'
MTETTVLILGFVITFGLLGYKLKGLVIKSLDKYSQKIADDLHNSEQLKLKAITALDEVERKTKNIQNTIIQIQEDAEKQIVSIEKNMQKKIENSIQQILKDNQNRILNDRQDIINGLKNDVLETIVKNINDYIKANQNSVDSNEAIKKVLLKVDFKKLIGE